LVRRLLKQLPRIEKKDEMSTYASTSASPVICAPAHAHRGAFLSGPASTKELKELGEASLFGDNRNAEFVARSGISETRLASLKHALRYIYTVLLGC
jgi:hypothetical protein